MAVRIYHKPLVLLIWFGPVLMAFGGMLSLSDRRLRVGAPKPAKSCANCRRRSDRGEALIALRCVRLIAAAFAGARRAARRDHGRMRRKESRARDLSRELRCMVCQNQSIDDSDAPLARDLRLLVRERIAAGDSDAQVMDFLVARYGEFVLLKPRFTAHLLLWLLPPLALAGGGLRCGCTPAPPNPPRRESQSLLNLSADEEARLERLIAAVTAAGKHGLDVAIRVFACDKLPHSFRPLLQKFNSPASAP